MNKQQLERNVGSVGRLRPAARDENGHDLDHDWLIEKVTDEAVILKHTPTAATVTLGFDHIKERMSDKARDSGRLHPSFGFLLLNVEVHRIPGGSFISEPIVPRLGRAVPPRGSLQPDAKTSTGPVKGLVQLFTHIGAGDSPAVPPQRVESWLTHAGWEVERGNTSLQIHADGVWVHGGEPSEQQRVTEWLRAQGIEGQIDERKEDVPLQVIIGRVIRKEPDQETFAAFWKKGGVQSIRVKNRTMEILTGVAVIIDAIEWWFDEQRQWAPCEDGRPNFFPKKLTGGTTRLTPGEEADFTFVNDPSNNPPRMQFHEIDGGGLDGFILERRGHRRVIFRVVSNQRPAFKGRLPMQWDKSITARASSDPPGQ